MFQLDMKSRKSIYEQVVDNIKDLILSGVIKSEDKLPSVRELSKVLTVNPNTVQKAYKELEYQGYVYSVSGLGTFASKKIDIKMDIGKKEDIKQNLLTEIRELLYLGLSEKEVLHEFDILLKKITAERGIKK